MPTALYRIILTAVILSAGSALSAAELVYSTAGYQDPLDNTGGGARAVGMGRAFAGVADDEMALLWNPAGLSTLPTCQVSLNHSSWLSQTFQEVLVVGFPTGKIGGVGLTANYTGYGSFDGRDAQGFPQASYGANQMGLGFGWGKKVLGDLAFGLSFLAEQQNLSGNAHSLLGVDGGLLWRTKSGWGIGLSYENLGLGPTSLALESSGRLGVSKLFSGRDGTSFLLALGGKMEPESVSSAQAGMEFTYQSVLTARAGYDYWFDPSGYTGLQGFTLGAGINLDSLRVDYAYQPYGELGDTNLVSLSYLFGNSARKTPTPALTPVYTQPLRPVYTPVAPAPVTVVVASAPTPAPAPATQAMPQVVPQAVGAENPSKKTITMEFDVPAGGAVQQAQALEKSGQLTAAAATVTDDLRKTPGDAGAWRELGNVYFRMGHKTSAVYCFGAYLRLKPGDQALADWLAKYQAQP